MQKRYIWLAGSFPDLVIAQGRGQRGPVTYYNLDHDNQVLTIFGYSNPLRWLAGRGLVRELQGHNKFTLSEAGEAAFRKLLLAGDGGALNAATHHAKLKPRQPQVLA
jgi:hypothetical protein